MPKYIAKQSIGHFRPGSEIKGLDANRIQALLASGAIEEYTASKQEQSGDSSNQLQQLAAEIADLKVDNQKLSDEKLKADAEIADLKALVVKLEKELTTATAAAPAKGAKAASDKGATETK